MSATLASIEPSGSAPLASLLSDARPGVRVVIVSDFLGDEPDARTAASALLAAHSDVHAVQVVAEEELDPGAEAMRAQDPEDVAMMRPFDEALRSRYQANFTSWRERVAAAWRHAGATWTTVTTSEDPSIGVRRVISASSGEPVAAAP